MIKLNYSYTILFASTVAGVGTAADSTPTAVLWRNGSASGVSVTVSTTAQTGLYKAVFTTDSGWANGDFLELYATATIAGTAGYLAKVWSSTEIGAAVLDPAVIARLWTEEEKAQIRYRLGLEGTATAPPEPDVDPIVITPATGIMTTGYLVTRVKGVPTAGITIRYQQAQEPASDRGSSYDDTIYSAVSNSEGIAELSLVKGGLYYVWRSASTRPMNLASYRVLKADGSAPDATLALPSHVGA